ncbi:hypothetical protein J2S74_002921 [Evansella vedderi]|uniref:DUF3267 domain-containing protein n=1 Tax=Evansella vedderi TaxID=38282 RepID=A0ABT9ZWC5_9BACI|nr:metalloprotease family protein [Evansella vedderi]MDQ0255539.1 hypothetical protein [Evansella vedderi]
MNKKYEFNLEKNKFHKTFCLFLGLVFAVWLSIYFVLPVMSAEQPVYLLLFVLMNVLVRYPHEGLHYLAGKMLGIRCDLTFNKINPFCKPERDLNSFELFFITVAPFIILSLVFGMGALIPGPELMQKLMVTMLVGHTLACYADFAYLFTAIRFKENTFKCHGVDLEVY